jgi:hypothetical protein
MGAAAFTALLSAALAGVDGTSVETAASVRAQTSAHSYASDGLPTRALVAEDVLPRLSLLLDRKDLRLALRYEPQLRITRDPAAPDGHAAFVQGGALRAEWEPGPAWRATGEARAAERLVDLGAPGDGQRLLDLRAGTANVRWLDAGAAAGVEGRLGPALTLRARASADDTGGVDSADRVVLPRMQELRLGAGLAREQTRIDTLALDLGVLAASVDGGGQVSISTAGAGWLRAVTHTVRVRLAASANDARGAGAPARLLPGADLEVESSGLAGRRLLVTAALRAGPMVDRYRGAAEERLGAQAALGWALAPRWMLEGSGEVGRILEPLGYGAARGDLRAVWRASRRVTLSGGAWSEWHHDPRLALGATAFVRGASAAVEISTLGR